MGIGKGACSEYKLSNDDPYARFSDRCWRKFPRQLDLSFVPTVVAKINVSESDEDLNCVDQGSVLTAFGCSFSPDSDRLFSVISVFRNQLFVPDGLNRMILTNIVPTAGFVTMWLAKEETDVKDNENPRPHPRHEHCFDSCSAVMFTYSPQPCCSFSPNGDAITVVLNSGKDALTIAKREPCDVDHCNKQRDLPVIDNDHRDCDSSDDNEDSDCDDDDDNDDDIWFGNYSLYPSNHGKVSLCGRVQCAVYSPCGNKLVTLNRVSLSIYRGENVHELSMWGISSSAKMKCLWNASCEVICPQLTGSISSCRFSSDSEIIGLASNHGFCMFVWANSGEMFSLVSPTDNHAHSACDFDFDPTTPALVAIVWRYGPVKLLELQQNGAFLVHMYSGKDDQPFSNCIKYSLDGILIAVGTMTGQIHLINAKTGCCMEYLDIGCDIANPANLVVFSVSFARSCQELIAAYSDGYIRIWQLPRILNLQHICRLAILNGTIMSKIGELPLPRHIKSYLLFDQI